MSNKLIIESIASDLKRVALGLHRGSLAMANRFEKEALERRKELDESKLKPYLNKLIGDIGKAMTNADTEEKAEDALMYSTLLQNYSQYNKF